MPTPDTLRFGTAVRAAALYALLAGAAAAAPTVRIEDRAPCSEVLFLRLISDNNGVNCRW